MDAEYMMLWEAGYGLPPNPPRQVSRTVEPARLVEGRCSRCNRPLKKRGAHFHLKACKGAET